MPVDHVSTCLRTCERAKCGSLNMSVFSCIHHWRSILSLAFLTLVHTITLRYCKGYQKPFNNSVTYHFRHWSPKWNLFSPNKVEPLLGKVARLVKAEPQKV